MSNKIIQVYMSEQLKKLYYGDKCCKKFYSFIYAVDRTSFMKTIKDLHLRMRLCTHDGQEFILVFKDECQHITENMTSLRLIRDSVKDMYILQSGSNFAGNQVDMHMSPEFLCPSNSTPSVPAHRFSFPLKQSITRLNPTAQLSYQKDCAMQSYKEMILDGLQRNRVMVINGASNLDKSCAIPMYIVEKCAHEKLPCKIVCVEREQLTAIYNSGRLAEHFRERIGETVAFQVQLQSRISDSSNLIYTTSNFFLRVLMGQSIPDSFRHISHVVIVDAHLHEAFADLLLRELKEALKYHAHLKVILLSNFQFNDEFINYFGEGERLNLPDINDSEGQQPQILYIENIQQILPKRRLYKTALKASKLFPPETNKTINSAYLDSCLEIYQQLPNEKSFQSILYMVHGESVSINYRHTITGRTVLLLASLLGKIDHVKTLIFLNADPNICDQQEMNAFKAALSMGHLECADALKENYVQKNIILSNDKEYIDHYLIIDIIHMICTTEQWKVGDVIVFLPSYEHILRANYNILKQKILGNLPDNLAVYLLHKNTEKCQLDIITEHSSNFVKIILATDIAETLSCWKNVHYVIDTGRMRRITYYNNSLHKENAYDWTSKQSFCFRLIPFCIFECLPEAITPELLTIPLDRVCLSVKLLSPHRMVAEYLQETIVKPPFPQVFRCVEHLKKIDVFSETEDITWLGCRLVDVPVDCLLGKLLVFAVLLQCIDPVLTIVSFMSTLDPFELNNYLDDLTEPFKDAIRTKMKKERSRLSEGIASDHFVYLRLYQEWQNDVHDKNNGPLPNEYDFILNGLLEQICDIRTQLVGALRSCQLIHSKGVLSMHYINMKSHSWPIIKAVLVGGLYPNICLVDSKINCVKSPQTRELVLHPDSVLRSLEFFGNGYANSSTMVARKINSDWIVYGKRANSERCNSINYGTVVSPICIALFTGSPKLSSSNIQIFPSAADKDGFQAHFHVDEWISFVMDYKEAQILLKTRQCFYSTYINYLQNCNSIEKYRRTKFPAAQNENILIDCLETILVREDLAYGFQQPDKTGVRPKAVPNKFIVGFNVSSLLMATYNKTDMVINDRLKRMEKKFFMLYQTDKNVKDNNLSSHNYNWFHLLTKVSSPHSLQNRITFVIMFTRDPNKLRQLSIVESTNNGLWKLRDCFHSDINLNNISLTCLNDMLALPLNQKRKCLKIDNEMGELIINLFAFRNNWLLN
uniref:Helicase-associated domain-containing protein n=1 Tax=Glossina palpalis gambiensis TaxID=67801 RepID=A0A1B0BTI0_9MUSC